MSTATVPDLSDESLSPDFESIFRQYSPMVYRTARAVTGNSDDAEDVVQTIFLKLIRREYAPRLKKNPKAYLYRAAVNMSLDVIRARRRHTFISDVERLETPVSAANTRFNDDIHRRLDDALAQLSPEAAEILILRYVHDYSDADISKLLGTSRGAIALRLLRLRARLKKLLRGPLGEKS
jgi:RNA polymerase sigma-70 factor (ECF subfamily)